MTKKFFKIVFIVGVIIQISPKLMATEGYSTYSGTLVTDFDNGGVFDLSTSSGFDAFSEQSSFNYSTGCGDFSWCPKYDMEVDVEDKEKYSKNKLLEFADQTTGVINAYIEGSITSEALTVALLEPMQETIVVLCSAFVDTSKVTNDMVRSYLKDGKIVNYIGLGVSKDKMPIAKNLGSGFVLNVFKSALIEISVDIVQKTSGHIAAGIAWFTLKHADLYISSNGNLIKIAVGEAMIAIEAWGKTIEEWNNLQTIEEQVMYSQIIGRLILIEVPYLAQYTRADELDKQNIKDVFTASARSQKTGDSSLDMKIEEYIQFKLELWDEDSREIREKKLSELINHGDQAALESYLTYWVPNTSKKDQCIAEFEYTKKYNINRVFYDVEANNEFYEDIKFLKNMEVVRGYGGQDNGFFKPRRDVSQYEFAVMICKLFYNVEFNNQSGYFDHLKQVIDYVPFNINIINKDILITRGEVAIILYGVMTKKLNDGNSIFVNGVLLEYDEAKGWDKYSAYLRAWDIANGYNAGPKAGYYGINENIVRAETASLLTKTYNIQSGAK